MRGDQCEDQRRLSGKRLLGSKGVVGVEAHVEIGLCEIHQRIGGPACIQQIGGDQGIEDKGGGVQAQALQHDLHELDVVPDLLNLRALQQWTQIVERGRELRIRFGIGRAVVSE